MDNLKRNELGRRSLKIVNEIDSFLPLKPLGVSNSQMTYERKSFYSGSLQKSPTNARKTLFDDIAKENDDFALCKDFSTNRENTGKSPVVVHKIRNSNDSQEKKKVKPRRSMLGLRSKSQMNFVKDDVTFTVSKPLLSSSPNNIERVEKYNEDLKPLSQRSVSTPVLTPFDADDTNTSAFFDKGISDSTWSVFKSVQKKSNFEPPATRRSIIAGKTRSLVSSDAESNFKNNSSKYPKNTAYEHDTIRTRSKTRSLISSVDQEAKLKWLAQKFQMEGNNHLNLSLSSRKNDLRKKEIKEVTHSEDGYSSENGENSIDQEEGYEPDKMVSPLRGPVPENVSPVETITYMIQEPMDDSVNSTDSYIENEMTILNSGKSTLEKIEEEIADRTYKNNTSDDDNDLSATENHQGETTCINQIIDLFEELRTEKENMDSKWFNLMRQKELWDKKWNVLALELKNISNTSKMNGLSSNSSKKKPIKVISTKIRRSFFLSPKSGLSLSKSSTMSSSKTYSDLKKSFNICKTPISSDKRLNRFKKSGCYTPNTLSIMVDDQEKDIFGEL